MPRAATLPCTALDPDDPITDGWYITEYDGKRMVSEVSSDNWGMKIKALGREWFIGQPNMPVRLIARADLDRLNIHPPETDYLRAQIGTIRGMLKGLTEEEDPIGHRQFTDRLQDLEAQLARLEGRE